MMVLDYQFVCYIISYIFYVVFLKNILTKFDFRQVPSEEVSTNEVPVPSARRSSGTRRSRDQFNHSLEPIINEEDVVVNRHIAEGRSVKEVKQQAVSTKTDKVYIQTQSSLILKFSNIAFYF